MKKDLKRLKPIEGVLGEITNKMGREKQKIPNVEHTIHETDENDIIPIDEIDLKIIRKIVEKNMEDDEDFSDEIISDNFSL